MPLSGALLDIGAGAMRTAITHLSIATANPEPSGSNQATSARQPATWAAVVAGTGDFSLSANVAFTGGGNATAATYVCFWSAVTGGTYYGSQALSGDQNFNSAGEYTITALTINGGST